MQQRPRAFEVEPRAAEYGRIGHTELGCFKLKSVLGRGSYGTAYLAEQVGFDREAVLKIAHTELMRGREAPLIRHRFADELRAATRVQHRNLVTLYTAGDTQDGVPAIAMEYVRGVPLEDVLRDKAGGFSSHWLESCFRQLASALVALHHAGVVHRDLSPRNVMAGVDDKGDPKLTILDFGVAKLGEQSGQTVGAVGTPRYMPPEQVLGTAGAPADVFALGAILWWALTGKEYRSDIVTLADLTHARLSGATDPDPRRDRRDLPAGVAKLVSQMLAFNEARRISADGFMQQWPDVVRELPAQERPHLMTRVRAITEPMAMPVRGTGTVRSEPPPQATSSGSSLDTVVIDPNPITRHLLHGFLRRQRCRVRFVNDALELNERDAGHVDLAIVSSDVGGVSTIGAVSRIVELLPDAALVVTGSQRATDDFYDLGVRSTLEIPGEFDRLEELIGSVRQEVSLRPASTPAVASAISAEVRQHLLSEEPKVVQETIELFLGAVPELLAGVADSFGAADFRAAQQSCRSLQTNARAMGAGQLARLSHACAELLADGDTSTIPGFLVEIEREYGLVFRELMSLHSAGKAKN